MKHLKDRGFNAKLLDVMRPVKGDDTFTFYLYNLSGMIIGYQQYRPLGSKEANNNPKMGRYYTYAPKAKVMNIVGGLETYNWSNPLFICEGLFDAVKVWRAGYACIWTCGIPSPQVQHWIKVQPRATVALLDPGLDKSMKKAFVRCTDVQVSPESLGLTTDLGDMDEIEVKLMIATGISLLNECIVL